MTKRKFWSIIISTYFLLQLSFAFKPTYYFYTEGLLALQKKDYKTAIEKFEQVVNSDPQAVDVYQQLIYLYVLENENEKLKKHITNIEAVIYDTSTLCDIANILILYGHQDLAITVLEKILLIDKKNKDALLNLAQIYASSDTTKSLYYYKRYLELNPEDSSVYLPIAVLEYEQGNIEEAKSYLQKISTAQVQTETLQQLLNFLTLISTSSVNKKITDHKTIGMLFSFYVLQNNLELAEKYLKLLKKIPKKEFLAEYNFYIALFYEYKNKINLAKKYMIKFINTGQVSDEIPYIKLAYYYMLSKAPNKAKNILSIANKKFPTTERIKTLLFYIYLEQKDYKNAISTLYELKSISSTFKRIDFYLGYCYDQLGDFKNTEYYMRQAINTNPDDHEALNYLGYLYADKNINLDEAEQLILRALSYEPTNYAYIDSLAWVYYRKGLYEKSEQLFEKIKDSTDSIICEHIGDVKFAVSKYKEAIEFYLKSLKTNPKNKTVKQKIKQVKQMIKKR